MSNEPAVFEPREDDADTPGFDPGRLADLTLCERFIRVGGEKSHDAVGVGLAVVLEAVVGC